MKDSTRKRKQAASLIPKTVGQEVFINRVCEVMVSGKKALDAYTQEMGRMMAEAIMYMEREQVAGPDYHPTSPGIQKWASQPGSVYIGDQKVKVDHPRIRGASGEIHLESYQKLKEPGIFSEELMAQMFAGLSGRQYETTIRGTAEHFGVSSSSVSRHIVQATSRRLKEFLESDLSEFMPFAIFLDTIHRGGRAFIVALGINTGGQKKPLGFWEGATENHDICKELLADLESRGFKLSKRIIFVTDGGKGIIKALKDKYSKKLIHQRCTIHKDRNIQKHLPKKYRNRAHTLFRDALNLTSYTDAKAELKKLGRWLGDINDSSAKSLNEAMEELLTLHRLKVPATLRTTLHSTNPIESMFSSVRKYERNVKRYRTSKMAQRWLGSVLLHCEKKFNRVRGHDYIAGVIKNIKKQQGVDRLKKAA